MNLVNISIIYNVFYIHIVEYVKIKQHHFQQKKLIDAQKHKMLLHNLYEKGKSNE